MIPLSIVYKRGISMDGSHPTLLTSYGAYSLSILPTFEPTRTQHNLRLADEWSFLLWQLGDPDFQPNLTATK